MIEEKEALLLDLNSTFMFGEDRFGADENFSDYYRSIGGKLPDDVVNEVIRSSYDYLDEKYPSEEYRHCFPSLESAINASSQLDIPEFEKDKIIKTFSFHEHGGNTVFLREDLKIIKEKLHTGTCYRYMGPKIHVG